MTTTNDPQRLGRLNYEGYCASLPSKTTWDGKPLPAWRSDDPNEKQLTDDIRAAWQAGAERVLAEGKGDELLDDLLGFIHEEVASDDKTAGEGRWGRRMGADGQARIAMAPEGTHKKTVNDLCARVVTRFGGGHVDTVWFDPADHSKGKRLAIVVTGDYVPPAAGAPAPAALAEGAGEGERYPVPAGPAGPGSPPPPAQGEPGGG